MDNSHKKEIIEMLEKNEEYSKCLQSVPNEEERRKIKAFAEDIFTNMFFKLAELRKASAVLKETDNRSDDISKK